MKWQKITKDDPKEGEDVIVWDISQMFTPKWGHNVRTKGGWMRSGSFTHFIRVESVEQESLTIEDINAIFNDD